MPSGRVHALGPGLLIFEIQQTSDITYRIYDFDRVDDKGVPRQLHTDLALEAIDFTHHEDYRSHYEKAFNRTVPVVESKYFNTSLMHFGTQVVKDYSGLDSFVIIQCAEGSCSVDYEGGTETLKAGEVMLVPAITEEITINPHMETRLLEVYYPQE
jgi:mannose-6-phosphate isomerase